MTATQALVGLRSCHACVRLALAWNKGRRTQSRRNFRGNLVTSYGRRICEGLSAPVGVISGAQQREEEEEEQDGAEPRTFAHCCSARRKGVRASPGPLSSSTHWRNPQQVGCGSDGVRVPSHRISGAQLAQSSLRNELLLLLLFLSRQSGGSGEELSAVR